MRRYVGYALLLIAFLTSIIWAVSRFVQPILPKEINGDVLLFLVLFTSTIGVIAGFKDIIELLRLFSSDPKKKSAELQHNLPQPDYERFVGRKEEIKQIQRLLSFSSRHFVITIDGVGGIGKTALALEVAYTYLRQHKGLGKKERFQAVIWTTAKKTVLTGEGIITYHQSLHTLEDIYSPIATLLMRQDILDANLDNQDDLIRHALTKQRTLLIIDNLETIDDERVMSFIRDVPSPTKVIVTTRHRLDVAYPIRLVGMKEGEALEFLKDECKKKGVTLSEHAAKKLIQRTGGVPLAIVWSVALMGMGHSSEAVLARLGEPTSDISKFCFEGVMGQIRGTPAYQLLMALAYLDNNADRQSLSSVTRLPQLDRDDGLVMLEKLSLVNREGDLFRALPLTLSYSKAELQEHPDTWIEWTRPYLERYIELIRRNYGATRIFGMKNPIPTERIFTLVEVFQEPTAFQRATIEQLQDGFLNTNQSTSSNVERKDALELLKETNRLFLLGKPGSGKTTFLKNVALQAFSQAPYKIPIFVDFRSLADSKLSIFDFIVHSFDITKLPFLKTYIEQILETGNAVLLFDGLDEVSQVNRERIDVAINVERFATLYNSCQYVITSRVAAVEYVFDQFTYAEIAEFNGSQIGYFVKNWFLDDERKSELFLSQLYQAENKGLLELAQTPLLLTMLCLTFQETLTFPQRRAELFEEAIDALLRRWDSSRNIQRDQIYKQLSLRHKMRLFSVIAAETFERGVYYIPQSELESIIIRYLAAIPGFEDIGDIDSSNILRSIEAQHGILVERAQRVYSFATLSFHEYFTARYIAERERTDVLNTLVVNHLGDPRWHEVFLLTVSLLDNADDFLNFLLHQLEGSIEKESNIRKYWLWISEREAQFSNDDTFKSKWGLLKQHLLDNASQVAQELTKQEIDKLNWCISVSDLLLDCVQLAVVANKGAIEERFWKLPINSS